MKEIKVSLSKGSRDSKYISRIAWQMLFNVYREQGGSLDDMNEMLCDLYTLESWVNRYMYTGVPIYWEVFPGDRCSTYMYVGDGCLEDIPNVKLTYDEKSDSLVLKM